MSSVHEEIASFVSCSSQVALMEGGTLVSWRISSLMSSLLVSGTSLWQRTTIMERMKGIWQLYMHLHSVTVVCFALDITI